MKRSALRLFAFCAALSGLVLLPGCRGGKTSFTWRVDAVPSNLDPQVASRPEDVTACLGLYSALFRLDEAGQPQPDACESYTVSADGLTWTFTLRSGLAYRTARGAASDIALTSEDFAFGLRRVFLPETASPYAAALAAIQGSASVLAGGDPAALGIETPDERTLTLHLSVQDPELAAKLSLPAAAPCDEGFFASTQGAYALSSQQVLTNGPYFLYNWTESGLFLRRAAEGSLVSSLRLVLAEEDGGTNAAHAAERVESGKASAAILEGSEETALPSLAFTTRTWALVFNTENTFLANAEIRRALAASTAKASLTLPSNYQAAQGLVPPGVTVGGQSYRAAAGPAALSAVDAAASYLAGLGALGELSLRGVTVLAPDDEALVSLFDSVHQQWQTELGVYCRVERLPADELAARLASGDYDIALAPLECEANSPAAWLGLFASGGLAGWDDASFTARCQALAALSSLAGHEAEALALERELLAAAPCAPLVWETRRLLLAEGLTGLVFSPFGPTVDTTWTHMG